MKKLFMILAAAAALTVNAQQPQEVKEFCVGEFENPGKTERDAGGGSWWERAPFQWYTKYAGTQIIYSDWLLEGLPTGAQISEVVFKYGDDGSTSWFKADLDFYIENTESAQFQLKDGSEDYMWEMMDPSTSHGSLEYEVELYYLEDEEIHFVLDKPLKYEGKNLLLTMWSERTLCEMEEPKASFDYAVRTDRPTVMSMGSDRDSFLDCYDTGIQYPYHSPSKYVPVLKLVYTDPVVEGIASVETDANAPAEFFTLQGVRVSPEALSPGLYLRRQGNKASKVFVK